ncbi:hypothetical protein AB0K00_25275 [Dactylosporangium sp. NPDC049525]|uniref:hypothetical protein n=1 Tax=Dactylosporangium sp. NPDC049525 TaxID=3154730 RepID=UPI0034484195
MNSTSQEPVSPSAQAGRLARGILAAAMIVGPLVQVAFPLLQPWPADTDDYVADVGAHTAAYRALAWLGLLGAVTMAPAVAGLAALAWRGAPRLALAGAVLAVPGMLNPDGNPDDLVYAAARAGAADDETRAMLDRLGELPPFTTFGFYAFGVAFAVGGLLLGAAVLIGRTAPRWAAVALLAASCVALLGSYVPIGAAAATAGWAVASAGFIGCAVALLRQRDTRTPAS